MGTFGYGYGKRQLEINGEVMEVELYASNSFDRRRFHIPSIPLNGYIDFENNYLRVSGSDGKTFVRLPDREMTRDRSREEFYPNRIPDHAAALLLALEHEGPVPISQERAVREVLDPSLIVVPGI